MRVQSKGDKKCIQKNPLREAIMQRLLILFLNYDTIVPTITIL